MNDPMQSRPEIAGNRITCRDISGDAMNSYPRRSTTTARERALFRRFRRLWECSDPSPGVWEVFASGFEGSNEFQGIRKAFPIAYQSDPLATGCLTRTKK